LKNCGPSAIRCVIGKLKIENVLNQVFVAQLTSSLRQETIAVFYSLDVGPDLGLHGASAQGKVTSS
jgi:hypothetical protein